MRSFTSELNKSFHDRTSLLCSLNVISLLNHKDEIELLLTDNKIDILVVNETRLDPTVDENLIQISGYNHDRCERNRQGGVVLVYIKDCINYEARSHLPSSLLELIAIEIKPKFSKPFLLLLWYRPPNYKPDDFEQVEKLLCLETSTVTTIPRRTKTKW